MPPARLDRSGRESKLGVRRKHGFNIAVFSCQHRRDILLQLLGELGDPGGVNVRQVTLPCSGKLEVGHLTKALENGAEGVAIFGCPEKECRYVVGSERAKRRVHHTERILQEIGLEGDRVHRFIFPAPPDPADFDEFTAWLEKVRAMKSIHC